MRRLAAIGALAVVVWRVLSRRRRSQPPRVVVGYADGTTVSPEPDSFEHRRLVEAAREALRA
jgi:hypothetical protein